MARIVSIFQFTGRAGSAVCMKGKGEGLTPNKGFTQLPQTSAASVILSLHKGKTSKATFGKTPGAALGFTATTVPAAILLGSPWH